MIKKLLIFALFILFTYLLFACIIEPSSAKKVKDTTPTTLITTTSVEPTSPLGDMIGDWNYSYQYHIAESDYATRVAVDLDDNIIAVGVESITSSDAKWRIMKFDPNGTLLYSRYDLDFSPYRDAPESVAVDSNRNIIVVGYDKDTPEKYTRWRVMKFDPTLANILWWDTNDFPPVSGDNFADGPYDVAVSPIDDSVIVVGYDQKKGNNLAQWRVIKYDQSGNLEWNRSYDPNPNRPDRAWGVAVQSNGDIIVVGSDYVNPSTKHDWSIKKLDPSTGDVISSCNETIYLTDDYDKPQEVAVDSDDNIIIVGYEGGNRDSQWRVIKLNPDCSEGAGSWRYAGNWSAKNDRANSVAVDDYKNIIVVGFDEEDDDQKWRIRKFDPDGTLLWENVTNWLVDVNSAELPHGVAKLETAYMVVVGSDDSPSAPDKDRQWRIIKFKTIEYCTNKVDDDFDLLIDCLDPECPSTLPPEQGGVTCGECKHPECNYFVTDYSWTCQNDANGTDCGTWWNCPDVPDCLSLKKRIYPEDGSDWCNETSGECETYGCTPTAEYCTDDDPFDGINTLDCLAPCDNGTEDTNCPHSETSICDDVNRLYGTRDTYGYCNLAVCSCENDDWTWGTDSDADYCSNCDSCPLPNGDGLCNCGEDYDTCPEDCDQCVTDPDCDDGNECTQDTCNATSQCEYANVVDGTSCGTLGPGMYCCSGICDMDGITNADYHIDCSDELACTATPGNCCLNPGEWGYSNTSQLSGCDAWVPYCKVPNLCDSWDRRPSCDSGYCNGPDVEQDTTGPLCQYEDCGICCSCGSNDDPTYNSTQVIDCPDTACTDDSCILDSYPITWDWGLDVDNYCDPTSNGTEFSCTVNSCDYSNHTCADYETTVDFFPLIEGDYRSCTAETQYCDQASDCAYTGCQGGDCECLENDCLCKRCNFCYDSRPPTYGSGSDYGMICGLTDTMTNYGLADDDYEWYWLNCYESAGGWAFADVTIKNTSVGGVYEVCVFQSAPDGQGPPDPGWCPQVTDNCTTVGITTASSTITFEDWDPDNLTILAHRISGPAGYTLDIDCIGQAPPNTCSDTDGGVAPKTKGTVSGYQGGSPYSYTDQCQDSRYLKEWYCDGTTPSNNPNYDCQDLGSNYICSSGRCEYQSSGGVGCPTLFVHDGKSYVKERKSRIHSEEGIDTIDEIVLKTKPVAEDGVYSLSLKETTLPEHSYIDSVRLFVDGEEVELISAKHSRYGDVTAILEESDDARTDTKIFDSIDLKFKVPELKGEVNYFLFEIEGYNPRGWGPPVKLDITYLIAVFKGIFGLYQWFP